MTTFGTFTDILEMTGEDLKLVVINLKKLIIEIDPESCEVVRPGDRAATYGVGPKKMSEGYCYIIPHKNWVNLGFYKGAHLEDPAKLMEGTGKNMRHVKIRSVEEVEKEEIVNLIVQAVQERKEALNK